MKFELNLNELANICCILVSLMMAVRANPEGVLLPEPDRFRGVICLLIFSVCTSWSLVSFFPIFSIRLTKLKRE